MIQIAIVGKPNVGKSSLFNRLVKKMDAIISEKAGTTRDIKKRFIELNGNKEALLIDTGGLEDRNELFDKVKQKALQIAKESDIILYMVDGQKYPDDEDRRYFRELQRLKKPIFLVVNKIDSDKQMEVFYEYYELSNDYIFPISVAHNRGISKLLNALSDFIPSTKKIEIDQDLPLEELLEVSENENKTYNENEEIRVSIIGKVNVGKSSLLNALVGEERSIVSDVDGTTIDPIDESIIHKDKVITFVDTAGIRRRGKIKDIEKYALLRTEKNLEESDVTLLVLDGKNGITELDEKIGGFIDKHKTASIIVVNKWDENSKEFKEIQKEIKLRFKYLDYSPIIVVSAKTKRNIEKLKDLIIKVYNNYSQRIPTSILNKVIKEAVKRHHLPVDKTKVVKILYATQYKTKPPTISLIMNRKKLHFSYQRYLINYLRENFDFEGSPIVLIPKKRGENDIIDENEKE